MEEKSENQVDGEEEQGENNSDDEKDPKSKHISFQAAVIKLVHAHTSLEKLELQPLHKRILYPSKPNSSTLQRIPVTGGTPITVEFANTLRNYAFGPTDIFSFNSGEWLESSFSFSEPSSPMAWALKITKPASKGLVLCVQSYFLKHLLFTRRRTRTTTDTTVLMTPDERTQEECLASSLSDILWKVGDKQRATLCLCQKEPLLENSEYFMGDGITEKIRFLQFKKQDELTFNLKKYLYQFVAEDIGGGTLLFLYSLIVTRGFDKLKIDTEEKEPAAVLPNGSLHRYIATLILTGRATPYLHNGVIYEGTEATMARAQTGTLMRSEIGFLFWNGPNRHTRIEVGSRLKTPTFPIWLTLSQENYGVLFNPNRDLMRDYHAENRFQLLYYSGAAEVEEVTTLTIDTREAKSLDDFSSPHLELLIHTKWQDASVSWNGKEPYV